MRPATAVLLALRFLSELALLVGAGVAGWSLADRTWLSALLSLVAMAVVTLLWGLFVAPQSGGRLRDPARMTLEVVLFGGTGAALAVGGRPWWGLLLAVAGILLAMAARVAEPQLLARRAPGRP